MILLSLTTLDEKLTMEIIRIAKNLLKKREAKQVIMLELEKAWKMGDQNDSC